MEEGGGGGKRGERTFLILSSRRGKEVMCGKAPILEERKREKGKNHPLISFSSKMGGKERKPPSCYATRVC